MSLFITSLNSGSNGNCYYVGNSREAVLVDAGISCREIETRMKRAGLHMETIKAVFISHEHTDHIKGVEMLSKKYRLPVYVTDATRRHGRIKLEKGLSRPFSSGETTSIGELTVKAFSKRHDAADPYSFMISCEGVNVGVFTDIGTACENVTSHFSQCHAAFLESNYDEHMLANGGYPYYLRKRISGGNGHLSNREALEVFNKHRSSYLSHLLLCHLSANNNRPEIVHQLFSQHAAGVHMVIAPRDAETSVYHITSQHYLQPHIAQRPAVVSQLALAF